MPHIFCTISWRMRRSKLLRFFSWLITYWMMAVSSMGYFLKERAQKVATLFSHVETLVLSYFILSLSASEMSTMVQ